MKIDIVNREANKVGSIELDLGNDVRDDVFKKVVLIERTWFRQPYGAKPTAGKGYAIHLSKRRRRFRTTYGRGISRVPRKVMWRRGTQLRFVGAFAPGTVGGRRAHPPKSWKNIYRKVNKKEWLLALKSGIIASLTQEYVSKNGQKVPTKYPLVLDESFNDIKKTKELVEVLNKLGLENELERCSMVSIRAGKGKMRNRRYKVRRGPLFVVYDEENLVRAASNIKGVDIVDVDMLLADDFSMGIHPGRLVLFTKKALEVLKEEL